MPSRMVRILILLVAAILCGTASPCYAGWGAKLVRVIPSLVKRAAISLIESELYDVEENGARQYNNDNPDNGNNFRNEQPVAHDYGDYGDSNAMPPPGANGRRVKRGSPHHWTASQSPSSLRYLPSATEQFDGNNAINESAVTTAFSRGGAAKYSFQQMLAAHVFVYDPLYGSVFKRKGSVKYIILHSTETASPADAQRVIKSWNNRGLRHPGAQFVVDRDGTIYSTTNPDMATVHINTSKTLPGYTNDNSIGIEIVRAGKQQYTQSQLNSVMYLVSYLQGHYGVSDTNVTTHHHVQPSDRSDPVNFDVIAFSKAKNVFNNNVLARSIPTNANYSSPLPLAESSERPAVHPQLRGKMTHMPKAAPDFRSLTTPWAREP